MARPAERELFVTSAARNDLVEALVDGRLLVSDTGKLRMAHEALLRRWDRARDSLRRLANAELRKARLQRALATTTAIVFAAIAVFAAFQWTRAEQQTAIAEQRRQTAELRALVIQSRSLEESNPTRALRIVERGYQQNPTPELSHNLARVFYALEKKRAFLTSVEIEDGTGGKVAMSHDRTKIITWAVRSDPKLWDREGRHLATLPHHDPISDVKFLPGDHLILTELAAYSAAPHIIKLWKTDGHLQNEFQIEGTVFLPADNTNAILTGDGRIMRIDQSGRILEEISVPSYARFSFNLSFSRSGELILSRDQGGDVDANKKYSAYLWNKAGKLIGRFSHGNSIKGAWVLDNHKVITWGGDDVAKIWSTDTVDSPIFERKDIRRVMISHNRQLLFCFFNSGEAAIVRLSNLDVANISKVGPVQGTMFLQNEFENTCLARRLDR